MKIYLETNKWLILTSAKFHVICCTETVFLERVLLLYGHTSYMYQQHTALGKDDNTVKPLSFVSMGVFSLCIKLRLFCSHMCVKDFFLHHENMSV